MLDDYKYSHIPSECIDCIYREFNDDLCILLESDCFKKKFQNKSDLIPVVNKKLPCDSSAESQGVERR